MWVLWPSPPRNWEQMRANEAQPSLSPISIYLWQQLSASGSSFEKSMTSAPKSESL